ncbi:Pollen allergen ole e 6 [Dillenia turbinata]|uniref:Pollen allergen ole e 6 n=1 Tax=Dillenia turbinata TaxID=194707 RepID=A0AAN8V012_9MAGN
MAKKLIAVFLMCVVVVAAMQLTEAQSSEEKFRSCFNDCEKKCMGFGHGNSFCEMKCDADCTAKEVADKLKSKIIH